MPNNSIENFKRRTADTVVRTIASGMLIYTTAACGPGPAPIRADTESSRSQTAESIIDHEKQNLIDILDNLPASPIKNVLNERVIFIYTNQSPSEVDYHGVKIKIIKSKVSSSIKDGSLNPDGGLFHLIEKGTSFEGLRPIKDTQLNLPYVGPILQSERNQIPADIFAADGTPLISFDYMRNSNTYYSGFAPAIEISDPDPKLITPALKKRMEIMTQQNRLKELCSHLAFDLWIEAAVGKMQELHLPISMSMQKPDGTIQETETVSYMVNEMLNNSERIVAALDLAAYYFAFKAAEGTDLANPQYMDPKIRAAYESTKRVPLGSTHEEMINSAIYWAITEPAARGLTHVGNIDKLP